MIKIGRAHQVCHFNWTREIIELPIFKLSRDAGIFKIHQFNENQLSEKNRPKGDNRVVTVFIAHHVHTVK